MIFFTILGLYTSAIACICMSGIPSHIACISEEPTQIFRSPLARKPRLHQWDCDSIFVFHNGHLKVLSKHIICLLRHAHPRS